MSVLDIPIPDLRNLLQQRLDIDDLFTVAEIKTLTRRFLRQVVTDSKKDFAQLLYLDEYRRTIAVYKPYERTQLLEDYASLMSSDCWPEVPDDEPNCKTAKEKYQYALRNAHLALIRLFDRASHLRAQRLELAKCLIYELEQAGESISIEE
ncbi:hypothetical protein RCL1_002785 [Eukaryota sp. TZLM3-RCL]